MKPYMHLRNLLVAVSLFACFALQAQTSSANQTSTTMKTYLIEREIPGAGQFTAADLKGISQKSCGVLDEMGPKIKWLHSYVVANKIYCVYQAENEELLREHGAKGGFPVTNVMEIGATISPATAK